MGAPLSQSQVRVSVAQGLVGGLEEVDSPVPGSSSLHIPPEAVGDAGRERRSLGGVAIPRGDQEVASEDTAPVGEAALTGKLCPLLRSACVTVDCQWWDLDPARWCCGYLPALAEERAETHRLLVQLALVGERLANTLEALVAAPRSRR